MVEPWLRFPSLGHVLQHSQGSWQGAGGQQVESRDSLEAAAAPFCWEVLLLLWGRRVSSAGSWGTAGSWPSEAGRGSGTVHRPGSVEVSVTVFYRSAFHRLLWRVLWDPFPWESHHGADCNVDPALVHAGACCHCHRLLCLCTSVNPALLPTWYYLA